MDSLVEKYDAVTLPDAKAAVLEDSIMHRNHHVTAGSKILESFISPLDATVVVRLESAGIPIIGRTAMDEFGAAGLFPDSEITSGAVSAVADGKAAYALCNDFTGAIRQLAAARGLYYIHPTYGTVSRYGLVHAVPSMDQIGIVCRTPEDGFHILEIISGYDPNDGAMFPEGVFNTVPETKGGLKIGIPANVIARSHGDTISGTPGGAYELVEFELEYFDVYAQVMQILCSAELSNNITRYDGIKFGYRAEGYRGLKELYTKTRTEALGIDAKLVAISGAMVLSKDNYTRYYDKALRIRRLIKESLDFSKYDVIAIPICVDGPYNDLALHALPLLCGLPSLTVPPGCCGLTFIANAGCDRLLFDGNHIQGLVAKWNTKQ